MPPISTSPDSSFLGRLWAAVREGVRGDAANPAAAVSHETDRQVFKAGLSDIFGCGVETDKDFFEPPPPEAAAPADELADPTVDEGSLHPDAGVTVGVRNCQTFLNRISQTGQSIPLRWGFARGTDQPASCSKMGVVFEQMHQVGDAPIEVRGVGYWASAPAGGWPEGQEFGSIRQDNVPVSQWLDNGDPASPLTVFQTTEGYEGVTADQVSLVYNVGGTATCTDDGIALALTLQNRIGDSALSSGLFFLTGYTSEENNCTLAIAEDGFNAANESFILSKPPTVNIAISETGSSTGEPQPVCDAETSCEFPVPSLSAEVVSVALEPMVQRGETPDGGP